MSLEGARKEEGVPCLEAVLGMGASAVGHSRYGLRRTIRLSEKVAALSAHSPSGDPLASKSNHLRRELVAPSLLGACREANIDQRTRPTSAITHVLQPCTGPSTKKRINAQGVILRNRRLNATYIPPTHHSRVPHPATRVELPRDKTKLEAF